jgi:purine nucleosidase
VCSSDLEVELAGALTRGMSVADWNGKWKKAPNVEVIVQVDLDRFVSEFVAAVGRLPR